MKTADDFFILRCGHTVCCFQPAAQPPAVATQADSRRLLSLEVQHSRTLCLPTTRRPFVQTCSDCVGKMWGDPNDRVALSRTALAESTVCPVCRAGMPCHQMFSIRRQPSCWWGLADGSAACMGGASCCAVEASAARQQATNSAAT